MHTMKPSKKTGVSPRLTETNDGPTLGDGIVPVECPVRGRRFVFSVSHERPSETSASAAAPSFGDAVAIAPCSHLSLWSSTTPMMDILGLTGLTLAFFGGGFFVFHRGHVFHHGFHGGFRSGFYGGFQGGGRSHRQGEADRRPGHEQRRSTQYSSCPWAIAVGARR
jgi:hypothetical protein